MSKPQPPRAPLRPPTRRVFVAMLSAAAAAIALRDPLRRRIDAAIAPAEQPRTRWIGHC